MRSAEWVHVPDPQDEAPPALGGEPGRRRGDPGAADHEFGGQGALADAAHPVRVPAVVAHHLDAFVGDVLGDGGQEIGGGEDLQVGLILALSRGER
jgi:hypothetical protein